MSKRGDFITWYNNEFKTDFSYQLMGDTVEGSPWHRERNVATHTDMVVSEYISWADKQWTTDTMLGAVACAFHDTGKPAARVEKFKPERGTYNSFGGHEIISARLWEDYAVRNWTRISSLIGDDVRNIYKVSFIIEHHMPYEVKSDKIEDIGRTVLNLFGTSTVFADHLTADTHGRIADDHSDKIAKVDEWINNFNFMVLRQAMNTPVSLPAGGPRLFVPIAPSGSGKSTHFTRLKAYHGDSLAHYSWDDLRLEWYDPTDYAKAYQGSVEDPQFNNKVMKAFGELVAGGQNIYVDNTNLSRKRRAPYIAAARRAGYTICGITFPVALQTVIDRQQTRGDKVVPKHAVTQHYMSLQCPLYGEFDIIEVVDTNLR